MLTPRPLSNYIINNGLNSLPKDRGGDTHVYAGMPLPEILAQAGVTMGKELRGENMTKYLLVKSGDGCSVVFSLAEQDSTFSDKLVSWPTR